jgi:hypothetical protein
MVLAAAILTIISAAFSAGSGYGALDQYTSAISYYNSIGSSVPTLYFGYLTIGILTIVAGTVAIAGAILMLKRKLLIISILGAIIPLVAVFAPYIVVPQYQYSIVEITIIIFAILSGVFVITSRNEFVKPSVNQSVKIPSVGKSSAYSSDNNV